ncbi:ABC transporter substrate-binding protein [Gorillibacterium massiliense]|uniref:ABC transporter substrate-binding protein n=1 Tax=Gorillibacterium massiliense TaxID=1280390 RepID=UPI0004B7A032|nr:ABC transporter substrate-binding protein [Gorillibacterium massiliense]
MKRWKKPAIATLTLMMSAAMVLSGCGKDSSKDSKETKAPTTAPTTAASKAPAATTTPAATTAADPNAIDVSKLEPVELRMVFPGAPQKDQQAVNDEINKYLKEKLNATIKIEPIQWGQWDQKVNLMVSSREKVDIMFTAVWSQYGVNVGKKAFLALNDDNGKYGNLLQKYGPTIQQNITPDILKGSQINGLNYGIPTLKEMASEGGVLYRKDIAQELGIEDQLKAAKTLDDLTPILEKVKAAKPDMTPVFLRDGDNFNSHYFANWDFLGDNNIEGVLLKDGDDTTIKARFDFDRYMATLKSTRNMFVKGLVNKDAATTQLSGTDAFKTGKIFMIPSALKPGKDTEVAASTGLTDKVAQLTMNVKTTAVSEAAGSMLAISSTSTNPERAMMFINLLHSDKYLNNLLNFGIEGTHYKKTGDNTVESTDKTADYSLGAAWMFGSQFLNYIWKGEPADKWDQFKSFNEGTHYSKGLGFTFDNNAKISPKVAATLNIRKQYDPALDTGSIDPEKKVPEYQQKMKAAGLDDIVKEKQAQFDAFLSKK